MDSEIKISMIQWSQTKPFIFYAIDNQNNFYVWDLSNSDIYPTNSIHFVHPIRFLKLSPFNDRRETTSGKNFMVRHLSNFVLLANN